MAYKEQKKKLILLMMVVSILIISLSLVNARPINCDLDRPTSIWTFNEGNGTNAMDSCYGLNATLYGDMSWERGVYGDSVRFNGINTYVDAGNIFPFNQNMPEFSFSLWVNFTYPNTPAWQTLFRSGYYYTNEFIEAIQINEGDNDYITFMASNFLGVKTIDDGNWHNVVGTFNGTSQMSKLYIDGIFINEYNTGISEITATTSPLYFGFNFDNGFLMNGDLDDIAFFNRTLSFEEIGSIYNGSTDNLNLVLYSQYPYIDFNSTYNLQIKLFKNVTELSDAVMLIDITEKNGSITKAYLPFNSTSGFYETTFLFNEIGDFPFIINANSLEFGLVSASGTFLIRNPFYLTVKLFDQKTLTPIENDFSYITAEYKERTLNPYLEPFIYPVADNRIIAKSFHSPYINGEANLKLYDSQTVYVFRWFDGRVTFDGEYAKANITDSYGTNVFLGEQQVQGLNETYQFVLSNFDQHPYRSLLNWSMVIALLLAFVSAVAIFLWIPQYPMISLMVGIVFPIIIVAIRLIIWWFYW